MTATSVAPIFLLAPFLFMLPPWVLSTRQWKERRVGCRSTDHHAVDELRDTFREYIPHRKTSRPTFGTHKTRSVPCILRNSADETRNAFLQHLWVAVLYRK